MPVEDLGHEAAQLLSLENIGQARSLSRLADLAAGQVPGCAGAHATVWRDGELVSSAATHPDLAALADLERDAGGGPLMTATSEARDVYCPDTLEEERWAHWAAEAMSRGVRSSAHLVRRFPPMTLVLALYGVRPEVLDADSVEMGEMLARFGTAALANTMAYGEARRTATELRDSVVARAVTDQAKGILMHALQCSAEEALQFMRRESQQRHIKVTEVAARVIAAYGSEGSAPQRGSAPSRHAPSPKPSTRSRRKPG